MVEHHFTGGGQISASLNLLTYLAACTTRMRLGTAVVVLPWHNPVLLAEQVADARRALRRARGSRHRPGLPEVESNSSVSDGRKRRNALTNASRSCSSAWTLPGRFSHQGKRWQYKDIIVEPAPLQQPHPPRWMAAGTRAGSAM